MADVSADPTYKAKYLHHRTKPPVMVVSKTQEADLKTQGFQDAYAHQSWPKHKYHKTFDPGLESAPTEIETTGTGTQVEVERAKMRAIALRDRQRSTKIKTAKDEAAAKALGKDWLDYGDVPLVAAKVASDAEGLPEL